MSNNDRTQQRSRPQQAQRNPYSTGTGQTFVAILQEGYQPKASKTSPVTPPKNPPNKGSSGKKPVGNE